MSINLTRFRTNQLELIPLVRFVINCNMRVIQIAALVGLAVSATAYPYDQMALVNVRNLKSSVPNYMPAPPINMMQAQTKKMPVQTKKVPVQTKKMPIQTKKMPVRTKKMPVRTKKTPVYAKMPVQTKKVPVVKNRKHHKHQHKGKGKMSHGQYGGYGYRRMLEDADTRDISVPTFEEDDQQRFSVDSHIVSPPLHTYVPVEASAAQRALKKKRAVMYTSKKQAPPTKKMSRPMYTSKKSPMFTSKKSPYHSSSYSSGKKGGYGTGYNTGYGHGGYGYGGYGF